MCAPVSYFDRFYANYRHFLELIGMSELAFEDEEMMTDTEEETNSEIEEITWVDSSDEDGVVIPDGMLIATPEGSDWGDEEELPSMDDLVNL